MRMRDEAHTEMIFRLRFSAVDRLWRRGTSQGGDRSCGQVPVQVGEELLGTVVAEGAQEAVGAAAFCEGYAVEVVGGERRASDDDVLDTVQPPHLVGVETGSGLLLPGEPGTITLLYYGPERAGFIVEAELEADEADQVDWAVVQAGVLGGDFQPLVGMPQQVGGPLVGRAGDSGGEFLELGVDGAAAIAVLVGGLDRGDLVLVLVHVGAEGGDYFAGAFGDVDAARL